MSGRSLANRLLLPLCVLLAGVGTASSQGPTSLVPQDGVPENGSTHQPIALHADEIYTWEEESRQVVTLGGNVLVEQGTFHVRANRAVVWVDLASARETKFTQLQVYTESATQPSKTFTLATEGDLRLRSHRREIVRESLAKTPFYQQALDAIRKPKRESPTPEEQPTVRQTAFQAPPEPEILLPETPPDTAPPPDPTPGTMLEPTPLPLPRPVPESAPSRVVVPLPGQAPEERVLSFGPRFSTPFQLQFRTLSEEEQAIVITGGIIVTARAPRTGEIVDIEADRAVIWLHGVNAQEFVSDATSAQGRANDREIELYLDGNVEIRARAGRDPLAPPPPPGPAKREFEAKVLRADQIYFDVNRNRAIAVSGELEIAQPNQAESARVRGDEIWQLSRNEYRALNAEVFSSRLPSDPGLKLSLNEATVRSERVPVRNILFQPYRNADGSIVTEVETTFEGRHGFLEIADTPVFYLPYARGNVTDPFGPLEAIGFRTDNIFGTQVLTTFDALELLRLRPPQHAQMKWDLHADYLSDRGPAGGTTFSSRGEQLFGFPTRYNTYLHGYGIYDRGTDQLGGARETQFVPPKGRGRVLFRHTQEFTDELSFQGQYSYLSDKNFLEQYYKLEFDLGPNQETFSYLKWQRDNLAATALVETNIRDWVNETQWLPRGDVYWLGQSFFDLITYNTWASVGYADLVITSPMLPPPPLLPTTVPTETGRFNWSNEASLPFELGPVKMAPYLRGDLTYYSQDLTGDEEGRFYGGGGVRASMPLSRLYPTVESELFNLHGINHKIVFGGNYYAAHASTGFSQFPQLDRLNDDATDQSIRDITPLQQQYLPINVATALQTSPLYNPQFYAIRRLADMRVDTLDSIQVFQVDARQRWQTKRGYPGLQHTVDWLTLDLSASLFPDSTSDNFGETVSFIEYNSIWNVGDETSLVSNGWFDPFDLGARYYSVGTFFSRAPIPGPPESYLYLGYRQIDPLDSKAVTATVTYRFSPKYAMSAISTYDFGIAEALTNQLVFSRSGTDLVLNIGFTYQALVNNFGFTFEVIPNIVAAHTGPRFIQNSPIFGER